MTEVTIFDIVGINAKVQLGDKSFPIVDPKYLDKVNLLDEWDALNADIREKKQTSRELAKRDHELKKRYILLYVPTMKDEIEKLGQHTLNKFFTTVTDMAADEFGAQVRKIDQEKKPSPQAPA